MQQPVCDQCGSAACLGTGMAVCRHTRRARGAKGASIQRPAVDKMMRGPGMAKGGAKG